MATRITLTIPRFNVLAGALAITALLALGGCSGDDESRTAGFLNGAIGGSTPPPSGSTPPPTTNPLPTSPNSGPGSATLSWNPPTERTDGTPLSALSGYKIVYGPYSRNYRYAIDLDNPGLTRYFIDGLGPGTWYFAVIAIDSQGMQSTPSAEVSKTI
jgi:hypothetical protein